MGRELAWCTPGSKACLGRRWNMLGDHLSWVRMKGSKLGQGENSLVGRKPPCRWLLKVVIKRAPIAQLPEQLGNICWHIWKALKILHTRWPRSLSKGSYRCPKFSQICQSKCCRSNMSLQIGHLTDICQSNVACQPKWLSVKCSSVNYLCTKKC